MDRPVPSARRHLHLPRLPLIGREDDLVGLEALLRRPTTRLITIAGLGGIGKTHLALELAGRLAASAPTSVVELASVSDVAFVVPSVAEALGAATVDGTDAIAAVDAAIGRRGAVLVLDNLEHLPGVGQVVLDLLAAVADLRVVATSRLPLAVSGEHVWHVQPLGLPDEATGRRAASLPGASRDHGTDRSDHADRTDGAVELFRSVAEAVDAGFVLDDTNRADVIAVCRRLGGHPLAIELAAARIRSLGPAALRRELERRSSLPVLTNRSTGAPGRHRDLGTAFAWSHERLDDDARLLMRRLAVFEDWARLDVIDDVCRDPDATSDGDDLLDAIAQLVDHHLVDTEHDELDTRYRLAPPLRDVAKALLADDPIDHRRTHAAHEDHFVRLSRAAAADIDEPGGHWHLPLVDAAHDDLLVILERAIDRGDAGVAADVAVALSWSWTQHGLFGVHRDLLERTWQLPGLDQVDPEVRLALHGWRLVVGAMLGDRRRGSVVTVIEAEVGETDDRLRVARVSMLLQAVEAAVIATDLMAATSAADEALSVAAAVDDRWTARAEAIAGMVANVRADTDTARRLGLASLDRARRTGDDKTVIRAGLLLRPLVSAGLVDESVHAVPSLDDMFRIARRLGDPETLDWVWPTMAVAALERGDRTAAARHCADALATRRPGGAGVEFLCAAVLGVAAVVDDPATTALVHGMLADRWHMVGNLLLPAHRAVFDLAVERARDRLGDSFDAVSRAAVARPWSASVLILLEYAEVASGRRPHPSDAVAATGAAMPDSVLAVLTPRETEILRHLARGHTNKEISQLVSSSPKTVMHHTTAIYRKLGVRGRTEAAAVAHRSGLLETDRLV